MTPAEHAAISARRWGGLPEDYIPVHSFFEEHSASMSDARYRALRFHREGILDCETQLGVFQHLSDGRKILTRHIAEAHIRREIGRIPAFVDWAIHIRPQPWMGKDLVNVQRYSVDDLERIKPGPTVH